MSQSNQVPAQSGLSAAENDKFLVRSKIEISFILRALAQKNTQVTLYFGHGNDFILTSILAIDAEREEMVMDYGAMEELNQQALQAEKLTFVSFQDQVKIEFICDGIRETQFENRNAFGVDIPDSLLRMQRRDYYRIATPVINPLKCIIPLPVGQNPGTAEVTLLDISCGGMSVTGHHAVIHFVPGTTYENCRIALPGIGTLETTVQVKNAFEVTLKNGLSRKRAGCEFIDMPEKMLAMIRRYIMKLERGRGAR
jgi:c-di-GMP-binding flagellar brake protein YcgR